jgi:hypothetical protein
MWTSSGLAEEEFSRDENASFLAAANLMKDRIASNLNSITTYFVPDGENHRMTTVETFKNFNDLEKDCYKRAIVGMVLVVTCSP